MRPVILRTGSTVPELLARKGDYEAWFARACGLPLDRFEVIDGTRLDSPLPDPGNVDGLIITGSAARVHDHEPWSVRCGEWSRAVWAAGVPTLGVCYGHQLLGEVLGGEVGPNPNGREMGVLPVEVEDDPLFEGLGRRFLTILTHLDAVNRPPPGAEVIGGTALCAVQAMRLGAHGRTVQFHPEFDAEVIAHYIDMRRPLLDAEFGAGAADAMLAQVQPAPSGPAIMKNFLRHWLKMAV